jgi:hypothetical protein
VEHLLFSIMTARNSHSVVRLCPGSVQITYVGDTLIATKLTGDKNVPRGEITFQADLHPLHSSNPSQYDTSPAANLHLKHQEQLQPIILSESAAQKWGTKRLPRYRGLGCAAEEGFKNSHWMDGQLIIIGEEYFSFAWVPVETQIFFGRPSPELALQMLRDNGVASLRSSVPKLDDPVELQKHFAMRCLEMTDVVMEDTLQGGAPRTCIWHGSSTNYFE